MSTESFVVVANQYENEAEALADYEDVRGLFARLGILDTFDAVVVTRGDDGVLRTVKRVEEPTRHGARAGLAVGLAVGALAALLPAVGLGVALVAGAAAGVGTGAIARHLTRGIPRAKVAELTALLENGKSGLLVIAATDLEADVAGAITRPTLQSRGRFHADLDELKRELERAVV
jgi:uncharacterized membrane protein